MVVNTSEGGVFYADGTGGTSLKQLTALPNHSHSYLPLSGGTLTGSLTLPSEKYQATAATEYAINMSNSDIVNLNAIYTCDTANYANEGFQFKRDNGNYDSIWAANGVFYFSPDGSPVGGGSYPNNYTVIHSGNYTSYCSSLGHSHSYLPLSGGTVRGDFAINNETDTTLRYFRIWYYASNRKNRGLFRVNENNTAVSYYSPTDGINHELTIGRDGFKYNNNDIIHSGNIGSQSVTSATKLGRYTIDSFMTFGNHTNYVGARFQNSNLAQLVVDTYIEFWSSPGWFNSAWGKVTAHGGFTGNLTGNVTGNVSGSSGSCTGNAATATTATTAQQLSGFTKRANANATWGTLTSTNGYTPVYWVDTASSGGIGISDKDQRTYFQIDGIFYQNEGQYQVLDTNTGAAKSHSHSYLPLAGGTMTGNISFQGTKQSYTMIRFIDNTTDVNGNGISIGGGGATIIGGGESASAAQGLLSSGGDERMIICNDADIEFFSNCQSGIASRKTMTFNSSGQLIAGNFITNSDRRLKTNINEISSEKLSNSLNLNFVEFDYKDNDKHSAGHVAQEVKEVLPEFVHGNESETEHLSIDYNGLHSIQIKALIDENNTMKKEIKELKELIKTLINEK